MAPDHRARSPTVRYVELSTEAFDSPPDAGAWRAFLCGETASLGALAYCGPTDAFVFADKEKAIEVPRKAMAPIIADAVGVDLPFGR